LTISKTNSSANCQFLEKQQVNNPIFCPNAENDHGNENSSSSLTSRLKK
jgi:hypothetical protein